MKRLSRLAALVLSAALAFCCFPAGAFAATGEAESKIYFYNISGDDAPTADFIVVESQGRFGLIDTGHRYEDTITDGDGTVYYCDPALALSCQTEYRSGRDAITYFVNTLGITHLDFIIGTHAHSDHIGGVPEIASFTTPNGTPLVDESTVYFYKTYHHVNSVDDDLTEDDTYPVRTEDGGSETGYSWHNQAYYYQAVEAMREQGSVLAELSQGITFGTEETQQTADYKALFRQIEAVGSLSGLRYHTNDLSDYYDDSISFSFGELNLRLYNLYSHPTKRNENVNSIVTAISDGTTKMVSLADINVEDRAEQRLAAAITEDIGKIELVKAAHHGIYAGSNAKDTVDIFKPKYLLATRKTVDTAGVNPSGAYAMASLYAREHYGTVCYEAGCSEFALVAAFEADGFAFYNLRGEGDGAYLDSAENCISTMTPEDGWNAWANEWETKYDVDYYYWLDGALYTGWLRSKGLLYHLARDGKMDKGWTFVNGVEYYFNSSGALQTGWKYVDGKWYYFGDNGIRQKGWIQVEGDWYYLNADGVMQTGWQKLGGKWYYLGDDGRMATGWRALKGSWYYFGTGGAMSTGWVQVLGKWYHFTESGVMQTGWQRLGGVWYYLGNNGVMRTGAVRMNGRYYIFDSSGKYLYQKHLLGGVKIK